MWTKLKIDVDRRSTLIDFDVQLRRLVRFGAKIDIKICCAWERDPSRNPRSGTRLQTDYTCFKASSLASYLDPSGSGILQLLRSLISGLRRQCVHQRQTFAAPDLTGETGRVCSCKDI